MGFDTEEESIRTLSFRQAVSFTQDAHTTTYVYGPDMRGTAAAISAIRSPEAKERRSVELLFATTRKSGGRSFSEERSDTVTLGRAFVHIPTDHKMGSIELPRTVRTMFRTYEEKLDRAKHFIINEVRPLSQDSWDDIVRASGREDALIFVHGFNTTFDQALYRAAQIIWDLQYKGTPILFSWASWGGATEPVGLLRSYVHDRDSALIAGNAFLPLIRTLRDKLGIKKVNVVAHSMGNFMMLSALKLEAQKAQPSAVAEVIMAAPDVDRSLFMIDAPEVQRIAAGMTLYASSADRALLASKEAARGIPRAGDVPAGGPIVLPGIDTIDVTAIGSEIFGLNHDVFASNRSLIDDIGGILDGRRPPNSRLRQIWPVPERPPPPRYWRFVQ
jgi:esterase/lipase superfamily enzyme